jgi:hypothetical protein
MVERVVWALIEEHADQKAMPSSVYLRMARAVIEEMREPTDAMVMAAMITPFPTVKEAGGVVPQGQAAVRLEWQAMIDEALK